MRIFHVGSHHSIPGIAPGIAPRIVVFVSLIVEFRGGGSGGVQSTGVSQRVRATGRDESQSVPSLAKLFKTRELELPIF